MGDTHTCPLLGNIGRLEAIARGTGVGVPQAWVSPISEYLPFQLLFAQDF
jgi:hypothetical protein